MLKTGLLISTAMTGATLLLSGAYGQANMHVASRDPNTRFLCTYGHLLVSASSASGYYSRWQHVAVPITGHGQTVNRIRVIEEHASGYSRTFAAGIYSNTASGFPGKLIAGGTARAGATCGPVSIPISPAKLRRRATYWIEETMRLKYSSENAGVYWEADPDTKHKAYVQNHWWRFNSSTSQSSSYTSPWTKQSTGPYFKLK